MYTVSTPDFRHSIYFFEKYEQLLFLGATLGSFSPGMASEKPSHD